MLTGTASAAFLLNYADTSRTDFAVPHDSARCSFAEARPAVSGPNCLFPYGIMLAWAIFLAEHCKVRWSTLALRLYGNEKWN